MSLYVVKLKGWDQGGAANLNTEDDLDAWVKSLAPVVTTVDGPEPGVPGYRIEDDQSGSLEAIYELAGFTGDGAKPFAIEFRDAGNWGGGRIIKCQDATTGTNRGNLRVTSFAADGTPTMTVHSGLVLVALYPTSNGYWVAEGYFDSSIIGANANQIQIWPGTSVSTGDVDIGRVWWGDTVLESTVGGPHVRIQRERTLWFGNRSLTTSPTDGLPSWPIKGLLSQPVDIKRTAFGGGRTSGRSSVDVGDIVLANLNGYLDELDDYAFDGREVEVYRSTSHAPSVPAGMARLFTGTAMESLASREVCRIRIRDLQARYDVPLQSNRYAGTGSLEGGSVIKDEPKPFVVGKVRNVEPVLVDAAKLIYQMNDGAITSVEGVEDSGMVLGRDFVNAETLGAGEVDSSVNTRAFRLAYGAPSGVPTWVVALFDGSLYYSTDNGVNWTLGNSAIFGGDTIASVKWLNGEQFVAVGEGNHIATSPDGQTWTSRTSAMSGGEWIRDVDYGNGVYLAISYDECQYSTDGHTWTAGTAPGSSGTWKMAFGSGYFVAVEYNSATFYYTADGVTWGTIATGAGVSGFNGIAFSGERFVAAGDSNAIATSVDALKWTVVPTDSIYTSDLGQVGWGAGFGWCIIPQAFGDYVWTSRDGLAWEQVLTDWDNVVSGGTYDIAFGNGIWMVAAGGPGNVENYVIGPAAYATYSSEADLLDDSLQPDAGHLKVYAAGGYFRLGSAPLGRVTASFTQGATAADRTAAQCAVAILGKGGFSNAANAVTEPDLDAWVKSGTPVVTSGVDDPAGGTDAFTVEDNDGSGLEYIREDVTLTGYGHRYYAVWVRERTFGGVQQIIKVQDTTAGSSVGTLAIEGYTDGEPDIDDRVGTLELKVEVLPGWWLLVGGTIPITDGNSHRIEIHPADAATTGSVDVYDPHVLDVERYGDAVDRLGVAALDNDTSAVCGWVFRDEKISEALDRILDGVGAMWLPNRYGGVRFKRLNAPALANSLGTIDKHSTTEGGAIERVPTPLPSWRTVLKYSKNHAPQDDGTLAGGAVGADRANYSREWLQSKSEDAAIQTVHPLARENVIESAIAETADADTEAARVQTLRGTNLKKYEATEPLSERNESWDLGDEVTLQHDTRLGLAAGKPVVILGVSPDGANDRVTLEVLG